MDTNETILNRAVAAVIPLELAKQKLESGEKLRIYMGIDPTGSKLHLGHSVGLRKLKSFTDAGHHVIFLIGSFTAMIGDPTDRDSARPPLTKEQVQENFKDYKRQAEKILDFSKVEIRYNDEWLTPLNFGDIVNLASNFTVQQMLQRDMFEKRLKEQKPIALHEFLYPLMVGYDSVILDVDCEMGGSDQEFNMLAGRHLQKVFNKREKFVLTTRLIEGTDGRKMSKSYNNCVYLEDTPNDMYGKIMSVHDNLLETYFECTTNVLVDDVKELIQNDPKEAKMQLAREIVTMYHGADDAVKAEEYWVSTFSKKEIPDEIPTLCPTSFNLIDVLVESKATSSKSEARRVIDEKGVKVNGEVVTDIHYTLKQDDILQKGKMFFLKIN
jgi:tyrosyl-tRNA synthetase